MKTTLGTPSTVQLTLPDLKVGPLSYAIGHLQYLLSTGGQVPAMVVDEIQLSPRRKTPRYRLPNGEVVIITSATKLPRPTGVDGVLRRMDSGELRWLNHRRIDEVTAKASTTGWTSIAEDSRRTWFGEFSFRAEVRGSPGGATATQDGLRPPQLGALHAIGAHWSLHVEPGTLVMPTGTGKTETMLCSLAAFARSPLLVVVPSDALRGQTARKFLAFGLLRKLGVLTEKALNPVVGTIETRPKSEKDLQLFADCNVLIGTISSLAEGTALPFASAIADLVDTLVVDEAHHVAASTWSTFRSAFAKKRVIQFTATPYRRDGRLVDGRVLYSYPLGRAQSDGYFRKIRFEPVHELDPSDADESIAGAAVDRVRADLKAGLDHLLMARCDSIDRARTVHGIYERLAPDLTPIIVHSKQDDVDESIEKLCSGESRIAVCVKMLGEGFDLPQLKIAAIHDLHKSLAVLLQFVGRFTRTSSDRIGDATVIANIANPDVTAALERLYSEDADWNKLLSEMSSAAAKTHAELISFLQSTQRLDTPVKGEFDAISHQLLRPTMSTLVYVADTFNPKAFHTGLPREYQVRAVWLHQASNTLFFVTRLEPHVKWTRSKSLRDREWSLFVLHFDDSRKLLYLASSDRSSLFDRLAMSVGATRLMSGDVIFRTLGRINRLIFQNIGVKKHGRRNLRFAMYTGADVAEALSIAEKAGSVKSNLFGTGWEGGQPTAIGCSYKGRVWTRDAGPIPQFVEWCGEIGEKLQDNTIDTSKIIANVLIPKEQERLPDRQVLGIEWPVEIWGEAEDRVLFKRAETDQPLSLFELRFTCADVAASFVEFTLEEAVSGCWATYRLVVGGSSGFVVERCGGVEVRVRIGKIELTVEEFLSNYPPLVRFVDLTELDGNLLIEPQQPSDVSIPDDCFDQWNWAGVDIKKESIWKEGQERKDSIQRRAADHYVAEGLTVVFDDDAAGEAADLVCVGEGPDHIRLVLVHCKFSGDDVPGERVKDVVEVCSQAVRSAKWKWRFKDLCKHLLDRERRLTDSRPSRFLCGSPSEINRIARVSRLKEVRAEIVIVQPGLSFASRTSDQLMILASTAAYLKETVGVDLDIICSP